MRLLLAALLALTPVAAFADMFGSTPPPPALSGVVSQFLNGTGQFSVPSGAGSTGNIVGSGATTVGHPGCFNNTSATALIDCAFPTVNLTTATATNLSGLVKGNGSTLVVALAGTDYLAPSGNGSALTGLLWSQIGSTPTTFGGYGITGGTLSGALTLSGLTTGTQVSCLGLTSGNVVALSAAACGAGGGGGTPANPTATAGPSAINGTATTYMRSDAAPAVQTATAGQLGLVKPDGTTVTISGGVISAATSGTNTPTNAQTGTTYVVLATDAGKLVTLNNASSVAVTLPQAGTTGFASQWGTCLLNIGAGTVTVTPTTSTFNLLASQTLATGDAMCPVSDGANYAGSVAKSGSATTNASLLTSGTLAAARLPAFTGDVTTSAGSSATTLAAGSASVLNSGTLNTARLPTITDTACATWDSTTAVTAQTIDFPVPWATYTIASVKAKVAGGGSFTYAVKIGGTGVTSCNVVTANSASNVNTTCTAANTGVVNDIVSVVIASPSGTVNQAYVCPVFSHTAN